MASVPGSAFYLDHLQLKSQPLGINGIAAQLSKITAYPNPVNNLLHIGLGNITGSVNAKIYDMMGKTLDSKSYDAAPATISFAVENLPAGIYLYEVTNNGKTVRGKFVKE